MPSDKHFGRYPFSDLYFPGSVLEHLLRMSYHAAGRDLVDRCILYVYRGCFKNSDYFSCGRNIYDGFERDRAGYGKLHGRKRGPAYPCRPFSIHGSSDPPADVWGIPSFLLSFQR